MRFNPKARLDTSRIGDAGTGSGGSSGGLGGGRTRIPIPGGIGGGGIGGILVVVLIVVLNQCLSGGGTSGSGAQGLSAQRFTEGAERYANCKTGEDANNSRDCARVAIENSLVDFWAKEMGNDFHPEAGILTFTSSVSTGCGGATAEVGPFYCPPDETIYLDTSFFSDVLAPELGAPDSFAVEAYVLAHEFGHHISNLTGQLGQVKGGTGDQSESTRLELQADCYAGLWAQHAEDTVDADGNQLILEISEQDLQDSLDAARSVGDNRIQQKSGQRVNKEVWTHGSDEQRARWFSVGYKAGGMDECDTFSIPKV